MDGLVLVTQFGSSMSTFEDTFNAELSRMLGDRGVRVEVVKVGGLELDPPNPVDRASAIGASVILAVGQTESQTVTDGGFIDNRTYRFDASLIDIATERRVWRAQIESKLDSYTGESGGARTMALRVFEKLDADGLLPVERTMTRPSDTLEG